MESVLQNDDVQSGHTTDTIRVPDQKVHNYRSDRWIALKLFSRVSEGCFTRSSVESVCHTDDDVWSVHTTDPTKVPDQNVHNYRSDHWISLKFFHEFPEAVLHRVVWNRYCITTMSGRAIPPTRSEYRIKSSITIDPTVGSISNCFYEFPEAVLHGVAWNRYYRTTMSGRAIPPTQPDYQIKRSITRDPTVGSL